MPYSAVIPELARGEETNEGRVTSTKYGALAVWLTLLIGSLGPRGIGSSIVRQFTRTSTETTSPVAGQVTAPRATAAITTTAAAAQQQQQQ